MKINAKVMMKYFYSYPIINKGIYKYVHMTSNESHVIYGKFYLKNKRYVCS